MQVRGLLFGKNTLVLRKKQHFLHFYRQNTCKCYFFYVILQSKMFNKVPHLTHKMP